MSASRFASFEDARDQLCRLLVLHFDLGTESFWPALHVSIPDDVRCWWNNLPKKARRHELREVANLIVAYARMERQDLYRLEAFVEKLQSDNPAGLLREIRNIQAPSAERTVRRLRKIHACLAKRPDLIDLPPAGARKLIAEFQVHFSKAECRFLIEIYSDRLLRFGREERLDVAPLVAIHAGQKVDAKKVFALLDQYEEYLTNKPDTIICYTLKRLLYDSVTIQSCVAAQIREAGSHVGPWNEYAEDALKDFYEGWGQICQLHELRNWTHVEAWKYLVRLADRLFDAVGQVPLWPDVWQRLQKVLVNETKLDIDDFHQGVRDNLARLLGDGPEGLLAAINASTQIERAIPATEERPSVAETLATSSAGTTLSQLISTTPGDAASESNDSANASADAILTPTHARIAGKKVKICARNACVRMKLLELMLCKSEMTFDQLRRGIRNWDEAHVTDTGIRSAVNRLNLKLPSECAWKLVTGNGKVYRLDNEGVAPTVA